MADGIFDHIGDGFRVGADGAGAGGFSVGEIWDSRGQFEEFFNANVKPNVPAEIKVEVTELHSLVQP